jgi:hypothetical protein
MSVYPLQRGLAFENVLLVEVQGLQKNVLQRHGENRARRDVGEGVTLAKRE